MKNRRFIEETFPVKEVSAESAREKSIRHDHISTLHIWWARRPLASSRATNYAALIPAPENADERNRSREFIVDLCRWENSLNRTLIEKARKDVVESNGGRPPRVLDPFAGGGAIPLEALRLGCEVHSSDYNPVSVLIQKCTLEYPQKYGKARRGVDEWSGLERSTDKNPLVEDVRKWGNWALEHAKKEIGKFYPPEPDGSMPVGFIWARTIPCQNPSCKADIPLLRQFWLAKNSRARVALYPEVVKTEVSFRVVGDGYGEMPKAFDPEKGTISWAVTTCLACGSVSDAEKLKKLFRQNQTGERIVAVVLRHPTKPGKTYRVAQLRDERVFSEARKRLSESRKNLLQEWGLDPIPDESIHTPDENEYQPGGLLYNFTPVLLYGMKKWSDLFNQRQSLALVTFTNSVRKAHLRMLEQGYEEQYAKAVATYLGIVVDRLADKNSTLVVYNVVGEKIEHVFGRQALAMVWDYVELNPFTDVGWHNMQEWVERVIAHCADLPSPAIVSQFSATSLPYPDNYFDAVFTDPPYYDNVPYADLSDFFYVWLKRTVGHLHPDLFSTPVVPKKNEIIAELPLLRGMGKEGAKKAVAGIKTKEDFESMLRQAFQEIQRVTRPYGVCVIVYAHKSLEGWETLINSLLESGLIVTGAWPINTERPGRLRSQESAALASSIYIVARKMQRDATGFYNEVKTELAKHLDTKLDRLWQEGISGADFFIAAIGSAIEVFGKFEKVMDYEGNVVRGDRLLEDVREIVTDYAVRQILHNGFGGEISELTRLYVLWRWEFGEAKVPFDDARKLAQSCGVDLSKEWNRNGFVRKEKEFVTLTGPGSRSVEGLENSRELIDTLHLTLLLWEKGKRDDMTRVLAESGFGRGEAFFRVAQAVSETLPNESKEKKLLDGFLAGRERLQEEVRKKTVQTRLAE